MILVRVRGELQKKRRGEDEEKCEEVLREWYEIENWKLETGED